MKNPKLRLLIFGLSALLLLAGCNDDGLNNCIVGNNQVVTEEITGLSSFSGVMHAGAADVFIAKGSSFEVLITGEENILDEYEFRVSDDALVIETRRNVCLRPQRTVEIFITMPALESVVLAGSGNIRGDDPFDANEFRTELIGSGNIFLSGTAQTLDAILAGSGNFFLDFDAGEIDLDLIGSGNITLAGTAELLDILLAGSGNIYAYDCLAQEANVTIAGSGNCDVFVETTLEVLISGSGHVRYQGTPEINVTITGSGSLINGN
jgi:hypothetical protein